MAGNKDKHTQRISTNFIVFIPLVFGIALLTIFVSTSWVNRRNVIQELQDHALLQNTLLSERVEWNLTSLNLTMLILQEQHNQFYTTEDSQASLSLLRKYALADSNMRSVYMLDDQGNQVFSSERRLSIDQSLGKDIVFPHIEQGLVTQLFIDKTAGRVYQSGVLLDQSSKVSRVLVLELDTDKLFESIRNIETAEMLSGSIVSDQGSMISTWVKPVTIVQPDLIEDAQQTLANSLINADKGDETTITGGTRIWEHEEFLIVSTKLSSVPIRVSTIYSKSLALAYWYDSFGRALLLFGLFFLLSVASSVLLRKRIVRANFQRQQIMDNLENRIHERTSELKQKTLDLEKQNSAYHKALEQIRVSNNYLEGIINASPTAIITIDEHVQVMSWNKAAEHIFGWSEDEVIGKVIPYVSDNQMKESKHLVKKIFNGERLVEQKVVREHKNGKAVTLSLSTAPIIDKDKHISSALLLYNDISEKTQLEFEFDKQRQIFRSLFDNSPEAIIILDNEDRILEVNSAFTHVFGYESSEALNKHINDLVVPEDKRGEADRFSQLVASQQVVEQESVRVKKDGSLVDVSILGYPIIFEGEQFGVFGIYRDLTKQKEIEMQLIQAQKMDSVGRLAGGVAHDFNNMLGVILGYSEIILDQIDDQSPYSDHLKEIQQAAERSASLTKQLLAFARKQPRQPKLIDINAEIERMLSMLRRLIGENIELNWEPEPMSGTIFMDPSQLDQILINLCVNAREAIENIGHITIETAEVTLDEEYCNTNVDCKPGDYVRLAVSDDGCGMDRETLRMVFEPFYTTKDTSKGTGLGLATVFGIVKQNSGGIHAYSEVGYGTTFAIYLQVKDSTGKQISTRKTVRKATRGSEIILLVDDDDMVKDVAYNMLNGIGYQVLTAGTPSEAIEICCNRSDIRLLLTDVIMPEMNGRELYTRLLKVNPSLKCLYMSGYTSNVIVHSGVIDEEVGFIQKPFDRRILADKMREILENDKPLPNNKKLK